MPRPWLAGLVCAALALMVVGGIVEVADDRVGLPGILAIGALLAAGAATTAVAWARPSRPALYAATRGLWWAFALSLALGALGAGLTRRRTTPAQSAPPRQPV